MTPEPITSEPMFEIQPVPETARAVPPPFAELGPVIFDVMPPPGPPIKSAVVPESEVAKIAIEPEVKDEDEVEAKAVNELEAEPELKTAVEPEVKVEAEDEVKIAIEPETKVEADRELKGEPEDEVDGGVKLSDDETNVEAAIETPAQVPVQAPVEAPIEAPVEFKAEVPGEAPRDAPVETEKETEKETATESEAKQEEEATTEAVTVVQRERKDSGKGIDLEPLPKELESIPEHVPEIEAESKTQPQLRPAVLREADSGFWEGPEVESSKASVVELEPVVEPAHELESVTGPKEAPGVDTRDFGANEDVNDKSDNVAEIEVEAPKETVTEALPAQSTSTEGASAETLVAGESDNLESQPELAPLPIKSVEKAPEQLDDAASLAPEIVPVHEQDLPETDKSKDIEAQPEPEKVQKETVEPEVVAKQEPEPQASSSDAVPVSDDAEPAGPVDAKAAQPTDEPRSQPAAKTGLQRANTDSALLAAGRAADTVESAPVVSGEFVPGQEGAKAEADGQPCSAQVRQRGWKKRFLSLRYPVLFGRGM